MLMILVTIAPNIDIVMMLAAKVWPPTLRDSCSQPDRSMPPGCEPASADRSASLIDVLSKIGKDWVGF
ncbi:MAG: hypothetical protein JO371_13145 [Paraburkholderia sp.]|nr:hypothetical protein [Paraburkholderia sp.]